MHTDFGTDLARQILPLLILFIIPALVIVLANRVNAKGLLFSAAMGIENLWNWSWSTSASSSSEKTSSRRKKKVRTRAEQMKQLSGTTAPEKQPANDGYYPGLVNISGTYCFMNSTLQAMASLAYLQPHIQAIHDKAETVDVPTPVIDSLQNLFNILNTPVPRYQAIRPLDIIEVLSRGRSNSLLCTREHQDAQELFQLLSECIKDEMSAVDKEGRRDRGLGGLNDTPLNVIGKSVFDGLTANRRSCVECGYTEAVMHFGFDNWQLAVPRLSSCTLEECLADYTRLEVLTDCICRRCSMLATHTRLVTEVAQLAAVPNPSPSKKKRLKEVRKLEARVKAAIQDGRVEDTIKDLRMEKVFSRASTKQAMVARPPPILALHINRSVSFGAYASKNNVRVIFPEVLDLTPYTTSGNLSTVPSRPISEPPRGSSSPAPLYLRSRSTTPTPESVRSDGRTLYRLTSVVCHFGAHSFGHYIAYRRKPGSNTIPKLVEEKEDEEYEWDDNVPGRNTGRGWLRTSDDAVTEVGIESVLSETGAAFMLFYERVLDGTVDNSPKVAAIETPAINGHAETEPLATQMYDWDGDSEETLKPNTVRPARINGSTSSLLSVDSLEPPVKTEPLDASIPIHIPSVGPRIVRSVATGRGRSVGPPNGNLDVASPGSSWNSSSDPLGATMLLSQSAPTPITTSPLMSKQGKQPVKPPHTKHQPPSTSSRKERIQQPTPIALKV